MLFSPDLHTALSVCEEWDLKQLLLYKKELYQL